MAHRDNEGQDDVELRALIDLTAPWAIRVAATLRLADLVGDGGIGLEALATASETHRNSLRRLMRYLVCLGVFREGEPEQYTLSEAGTWLRSGHPSRLRDWLDMDGAGGRIDRAWAGLLDAVRTGEPGYASVFGRRFDDDISADPGLYESFHSLMQAHSERVAPDIVECYPWSDHQSIVDVGGGTGALLRQILESRPSMRGTLVDLPSVTAQASEEFASAGLQERVEVVGQSFFEDLPAGHDIYVLKNVLHGWSDEDCVAILRRCREACGYEGCIVVLEEPVAEGPNRRRATGMDLRMMLLVGGQERTLAEFRELGKRAGLHMRESRTTEQGRLVVEFVVGSGNGSER